MTPPMTHISLKEILDIERGRHASRGCQRTRRLEKSDVEKDGGLSREGKITEQTLRANFTRTWLGNVNRDWVD